MHQTLTPVPGRACLWLALVVLPACSLVVDTEVSQCVVDDDCAHFGGHPTCQAGVCVPSGLGPEGCFFGDPVEQADFANQCTTAQTTQFDNCARLGLCDQASIDAAWAMTAPPQDLGTVPPPVNTQTPPTVNCADVAANRIYVTGSTNLPPLIKAVQPLLYQAAPPYTVVFAPQTSCKGAAAIYDVDPAKHLIKNIVNNYAFYYDAAGDQKFCLLDAAGNTVDVGESDVYPTSCGYQPVAGVADYVGPIQGITFVVPAGSSQAAISAEAAHMIFAAGGNAGRAAPWTEPRYYFVRSSGTGTVQLVSRAINHDPTKWWGIDRLSAGNLVASMESVDPTVAEQTIGVLSNDFADRSRSNLRVLAFQQHGQRYGYLPDSTATAFDKANIRDGHYPIWGAIHLMAATTSGVPSPAAGALITQFTVPKLDQGLVEAIIGSGFVPACAMQVNHTTEVGPLTAFTPRFGCGCLYDQQTRGATTCQTCSGPGDCPSAAPACNYGYCEVQ